MRGRLRDFFSTLLAAGEVIMALKALRWVGFDMLLVVVLGGAVVLLKQSLLHNNRRPLI